MRERGVGDRERVERDKKECDRPRKSEKEREKKEKNPHNLTAWFKSRFCFILKKKCVSSLYSTLNLKAFLKGENSCSDKS